MKNIFYKADFQVNESAKILKSLSHYNLIIEYMEELCLNDEQKIFLCKKLLGDFKLISDEDKRGFLP